MQQQPAAGGPELTLGQLRPVAPALQHVAAQEQQQPDSPAKPLLHHSEFVAPQVSNGHFAGPSALRNVDVLTSTAGFPLLHHHPYTELDASSEHNILHPIIVEVSEQK